MSDTVIRVENISKLYRLGEVGTGTLSHDLNRWWHKARGKENPYLKIGQINDRTVKNDSAYAWALKDISFEVKRGEVLGIIGRNGAGKSTLLKILSRVTAPTAGEIKIKGRVASLLEVGTGFNPELTGRDNIYLNGAILGMRKREIDQKFDEIVAFSGVERYIDTPVKRYSSGMHVRLAFAVAAHLEPEILIVDEVLAVGDAEFQKKCLGKMQDVAGHGRTILFVSHNMNAISQLTSRCVTLVNGRIVFDGSPKTAIEKYSGFEGNGQPVLFDVEFKRRAWTGNQNARILSLRFDKSAPQFSASEDFSFIIKIRANTTLARLRTSFTIYAADGMPVGGAFSLDSCQMKDQEVSEFRVTLPCPNLAPGGYYCGVGIGHGDPGTGVVDYDTVQNTLHFEIFAKPGTGGTVSNWMTNWGRIIFPRPQLEHLPL
jgi:lipopolysaccharide transport system ATP-binding protein